MMRLWSKISGWRSGLRSWSERTCSWSVTLNFTLILHYIRCIGKCISELQLLVS